MVDRIAWVKAYSLILVKACRKEGHPTFWKLILIIQALDIDLSQTKNDNFRFFCKHVFWYLIAKTRRFLDKWLCKHYFRYLVEFFNWLNLATSCMQKWQARSSPVTELLDLWATTSPLQFDTTKHIRSTM